MKTLFISRTPLDPVVEAARESFDVTLGDAVLDEAGATRVLETYDVAIPTIGDAFTAAAFDAAGEIRCRMLANFGVGYSHIDVEAARRHGVTVSNTPDVLTDATADIGLTLLLATARRAGEGERLLRAGKWGGFGPQATLGTHVTGKVVGIVGMGRIGQAVARRCHYGFGMEVLYHNRSPKDAGLPARQVGSLAELMGAADFVVVTVPGGAATTGLIDAAALAAMKPEGILVNIARGEVVDEDALIDALERGAIAGAGLDVYTHEPHVPERLRALENCVLLPHLGSATRETRIAMGLMAVDNARAFAEGRDPPQAV
ncbi:D-isomer specific 2-hydroxyacid dehydrogenase family protein [Oceanicola granulosus HTCC2516]|uniref:D-isomer specific 2-hydroxyacid dehydrogenase family protein n=1 Tax=Oceanicola granulosus (strain ATCC BAA-861 / DSM 15982 / KCTC 12143 / HTCC2516) TaxID=314256 RepID=Q2CB19_OCEGH|nr:D-glycerate dehydrogenase [Oceanicola granulosus]EAR49857.1 D-isomer specific 2-hydroxyacid dehydrogenase family protein [Oceanicola granulosus HTCC2516]